MRIFYKDRSTALMKVNQLSAENIKDLKYNFS